MNNAFLIAILCTSAAAAALYAALLSRTCRKKAVPAAILTLGLGIILGTVCARLLYYVNNLNHMISVGWLKALLSTDNMEWWSFFGGAAGVCLAAALAAKIMGLKIPEALNCFAPAGALLVVGCRLAQGFLATEWFIGLGDLIEDESWQFFPVAYKLVWDEDYWEYYLAVYRFEAIFALAAMAVSLTVYKEKRFLRTVYALCVPQIFCESLLTVCLSWGELWVKVEQLLCMLVIEGILVLYGIWLGKGQKARFAPAFGGLGCAAVFVLAEFCLEDKLPVHLPHWGTYAVEWVFLVVLLVLEAWGFHRLKTSQKLTES